MFRLLVKRTLLGATLLGLLLVTVLAVTNNAATADSLETTVTKNKIFVSIARDNLFLDDVLYTIDPDGSNLQPYFDFTGQRLTTGRILGLRSTPNGGALDFHSDNAFIYTPAGRNLFRLNLANRSLDQVSPSESAGKFGETGNSTVSGFVRDSGGTPYNGAPVYLEGAGSVNTNGDGSFTFTNVPAGARWLVGYNNSLNAWEARAITVATNFDNLNIILTPETSVRLNFEYPVTYGNRIYYRGNITNEINWTDTDFNGPTTVYTSPTDLCTGLPSVDAFDVSSTGKIVVYDYEQGCGIGNTNHVGLYTMDSDGSNKQILVNFLGGGWTNWGYTVQPQVFWSPDGTRIALKGTDLNTEIVLVFDTAGTLLGFAYGDTVTEVVTLHGWSPDGKALLFSEYDNGQPELADLRQIVVNEDGSLGAATTLLNDRPISGATWAADPEEAFLPFMIR